MSERFQFDGTSFVATMTSFTHAQAEKPLIYYERFILDNNAAEELDAEDGHIVYFKVGERMLDSVTLNARILWRRFSVREK